MKTEIWLSVKGFENLYEISSSGKIRSKSSGKLYKPYRSANGYYSIFLHNNGRYRFSIHRLVAEHFIPNPENKPCVNHIDHDRGNDKVENLEWCTHKENMQHASRAGRLNTSKSVGEDNPKSTVTESQVIEIRRLYKETNISTKQLMAKYNVGVNCIEKIIYNKTWKHLKTN